jgi:serpin B
MFRLKKTVTVSFLAVITACCITACNTEKDSKTETTNIGVLSPGNSTFAVDLFHELSAETDKNILYSPYGISEILAMTYAGAGGSTARQMAETLHFDLPQDSLHRSFNEIDHMLAERGKGAEGRDDEGFRLTINNALWGQEGFEIRNAFTELLAEYYEVDLAHLDFAENPYEACDTVNDWINEKTEGRIPQMLSPVTLSSSTKLILTNVVYLNTAWESPFMPGLTKIQDFYLINGSSVRIPMMHQTNDYLYFEDDTCQAAAFPYEENEISMIVFLPKEGEFETFQKALTYKTLDRYITTMNEQTVILTMPKLEFDSKNELKQTLMNMGMEEAFSTKADFSGMSPHPGLFIGRLVQKSFIKVDEKGTEATSAVTEVIVTSPPPEENRPEPVIMTIDRPFIFLIRDNETGTILFMGRVMNPGEEVHSYQFSVDSKR